MSNKSVVMSIRYKQRYQIKTQIFKKKNTKKQHPTEKSANSLSERNNLISKKGYNGNNNSRAIQFSIPISIQLCNLCCCFGRKCKQ